MFKINQMVRFKAWVTDDHLCELHLPSGLEGPFRVILPVDSSEVYFGALVRVVDKSNGIYNEWVIKHCYLEACP